MTAPIVPKGKPLDLFKARYQSCRHIHVSGRQCGSQVLKSNSKEERFCDQHRGKLDKECRECASMLLSFIPPKGW